MVDVGIYTKNADIQALAGVNAGTDAKATTATDVYVLNVESIINIKTGYDWSAATTAGSIIDAGLKFALVQAGASRCAMMVINADPTGYSARERETSLDYLNLLYDEAIEILKTDDGTAMLKGEGNGV